MKSMILASLVMGMFSASALAAPVSYNVDPAASKVEWLGKKVAGEHSGTVGVKSGSVKFNGKKLVGGTIVIDMASIKNTDITDEGYNKKLVGHLASEDFFNTAKYNDATLAIKSAKDNGKGQLQVSGDLTIKGKTLPVTFPAEVKVEGDAAAATGKLVIDRTKYDIKYGSGKFFQNLGDKMINDEFELSFSVVGKK